MAVSTNWALPAYVMQRLFSHRSKWMRQHITNPRRGTNCGRNLYWTNAEIFGVTCFFADNQKTIFDDVEYIFVYTEHEGFHQLWDYDT
jgi:hypothetical protein